MREQHQQSRDKRTADVKNINNYAVYIRVVEKLVSTTLISIFLKNLQLAKAS